MATIVHFDVPADEPERAKKFYGDLFGWKFNSIPGMDFHFIETSSADGKIGVPGGLTKRMGPGPGIMNYIGVDSLDEQMKKVEGLGGKVIRPKMAVPGFGYLAICQDTEGNLFGLWQDDRQAQ